MIERARRAQNRCSTSSPDLPHRQSQPVRDRGAMRPAPAVDREQRGLQRRRGEDRDDRDQEPADPHRAHERERHEEQQREPDRDGEAGDDHGAAGGLHRPQHRLLDLEAAAQLLAEPVDDQQRVVDRDPDPDQEHEVRDVGRRRHVVRRDVDDPERPEDRARREQKRDRDREREPEHREQDDQSDRQRDRLALLQIVVEDRVEVVLDRGRAGDVRPSPGRMAERAQELVRVPLRLREVERRDHVPVQDVGAGRHERFALPARHGAGRAIDDRLEAGHRLRIRRVGDPEDDGERAVAPVAEMLLEDGAHALGIRPGNAEHVRLEVRQPTLTPRNRRRGSRARRSPPASGAGAPTWCTPDQVSGC